MIQFWHRDSWRWSGTDRCVLWLAIGLGLYIPYAVRAGYLLARPDVEPYFARPVLGWYLSGLVGVSLGSLLLLGYAFAVRRQQPDHRSLPAVVTQLHLLWLAVSAYALGPLTTPVLGLIITAIFLAALLFSRGVVLAGLGSTLSVLVAATVAERAGAIPYAPLFAAAPAAGGRLSDSFAAGTGLAALAMLLFFTLLALSLVGRGRAREAELLAASRAKDGFAAELERALASLRQSEERFRQLAENAREVFFVMDASSARLLYVSPTFDTMWGMASARLYQKLEAFLDAVHPDDRERVSQTMALLGTLPASGIAHHELEYRIVLPAGQLRWVRVRSFPIRDAAGETYRIGGLIEDVTDRKNADLALRQAREDLERRVEERTAELLQSNSRLQAEASERMRAERALRRSEEQLRQQFAELEQIYDTAPVGLALHDTALRYVRINERLAAINGHPVAAHIGRTVREIIPDISDSVERDLNYVLDTGQPRLDVEVTAKTRAEPGVMRKWLTSYYPLRSPEGRVIGVSCVVQDISELVWAQERARRHLEELAHVARLSTVGEMAAGIAHELNQPLTAMANYAFIAQHTLDNGQSPDTDRLRSILEELSEQALRAGSVVSHLRDFVRKHNPQRTLVCLNDMVRESLALIGSELRLGGVQTQLQLAESLPRVHADAIQIQQVILNLLRNAIEAMTEIEPDTRLLTIETAASGDCVAVAVSDSGVGFAPGARLFDAFFTTKEHGMGLGLAISRSIVEDHGGRLWGEPRPSGGATFRFTLPGARQDDRADRATDGLCRR